jgi:hypothetical protein
MALQPDLWAPPGAGRLRAAWLARPRLGVRAHATEARVLFAVGVLAYLTVGWLMVFVAQTVVGDAWSRVGNAYYILFSRDPHLAAIGFVWNPLPSLAVLPLLPLSIIWPDLVGAGFAGNIVSALFMAAAVVQVAGMLRDLGVSRGPRLLLVATFALHPMILYYGANGMSEAPFLFFLIVIIRYLARWMRSPETSPLVVAGLALAGAYLTRYEAAAAAGVAIVLVAVVGAVRSAAGERRMAAAAEALLFGLPFAAAFGLWSLASWIIVGSPFETFTSVYGNSSQVALSAEAIQSSTGRGFVEATAYAISQIVGLEPLLVPALILAAVAVVVARDLRIVPTVLILGAVIGFSLVAFATGKSFGWLRFYIAVVPLAVLAAGFVVGAIESRAGRLGRLKRSATAALALAAIVTAVAGLPAAAGTIREDRLAREEAHQLRGLIPDASRPGDVPPERAQYQLGGKVAAYVDALAPGDGRVLVDVAIGFPVVLQSRHPRQFVITTDRDFEAAVQAPSQFGVEYLLVSPAAGLGYLDALSRQFPSLYTSGESIGATLVQEFRIAGFPSMGWKLYRLDGTI